MNAQLPPRRQSMHTLGIVIAGLVVMAFGLSLLANNLGWVDVHRLLGQVWPLGLIVLGVGLFLQRQQGLSGVALIVVGAWFYAREQHWTNLNFWAVVGPALIMLLGASVVWRAFNRPRAETTAGYIRSFSILSGSEQRPTIPFEGADLSAVLGGAKIDLSAATMAGDTVTIDVFTVMGGIEIVIPRDWDLTIKVTSLMGACSDHRSPSTLPATKRLVVRGFTLMGGVEIKN